MFCPLSIDSPRNSGVQILSAKIKKTLSPRRRPPGSVCPSQAEAVQPGMMPWCADAWGAEAGSFVPAQLSKRKLSVHRKQTAWSTRYGSDDEIAIRVALLSARRKCSPSGSPLPRPDQGQPAATVPVRAFPLPSRFGQGQLKAGRGHFVNMAKQRHAGNSSGRITNMPTPLTVRREEPDGAPGPAGDETNHMNAGAHLTGKG